MSSEIVNEHFCKMENEYTGVVFQLPESSGSLSEMLIAFLSDAGYESFEEQDHTLTAYIRSDQFDSDVLKNLPLIRRYRIEYSEKKYPDKNWNKEWESNFQPVTIGKVIRVRATFHTRDESFPIEIIIDPEMAFGTGHHETTAAMMELMLQIPFTGKQVCDMGCGTGILAILAEKLGAFSVWAVDHDVQCIVNTRANILQNQCRVIQPFEGDSRFLTDRQTDILLANLNRNVLMNDMPVFSRSVRKGGLLLISGFYQNDWNVLLERAEACTFRKKATAGKNNWMAAVLEKE